MKIKRYNTISSIPGSMKTEMVVITGKKYEESIVDRSCFSPLSEQLKGLQPMTPSEIEQHYHFLNGKDDGRELPMPMGADIAEISVDVRNKQSKIEKKLQDEAKRQIHEAEQQALIDRAFNSKVTSNKQ